MRFSALVLVIVLTSVTIVSAAPKRTLNLKRSKIKRSSLKQKPLRSRGGYLTYKKPLSDLIVLERARKKLGLRPKASFVKIKSAAKIVDPYDEGVKLTPRHAVRHYGNRRLGQVDFYGAIAEKHSLSFSRQYAMDGILLGFKGHPHDWPFVVGDWIGVAQLAFRPATVNGWSNRGPRTCMFRIKLSPLGQEKISVYMSCKGANRKFSGEMTRVAPGEYVAVVDVTDCYEFSAHLSSLYGVVFYQASLRRIQ